MDTGTSETQSIDDFFDNLMAMGFSYEDCQQAVKAGLLTVSEAVEWIFSGKPIQSAGPTLQLRKTTNSIFDSSGLPISLEESETNNIGQHQEFLSETQPEVKLHGTKRTEEQRKQWDRFHEKQRNEAEQIAKIEKLTKLKEHTAVLQQIAIDRQEKKRLDNLTTSHSPESKSDSSQKENAHIVNQGSNVLPTRSTIQVRCPNGSVVKREFDCNDNLSILWDIMKEMFPNAEEIALLQPFPRYEFTAQDLNKSFAELRLVPSGSLVLNIQSPNDIQTTQHPPTRSRRHRRQAAPVLVDVPRRQPLEEDAIFDLPAGHGHAGAPLGDPPMANLMADMHQMLENAGLGHVWGSGQKLSTNQNNQEVHHNAKPLDLAREAALSRACNRDPDDVADSDHSLNFVPSVTIPCLVQKCIQVIMKRIIHPSTCTTGLSLPAGVAERILQQMMKELVLTPRTLQPFISCHLNNVVLDFYPYATNELLYALRHHTAIKHISLVSCSLINDSGLQNLTYLKRLVSLNLRDCAQITDSSFQYISGEPLLTIYEADFVLTKHIPQFLSTFLELQQLTTLNLDGTKITDLGLQTYIASSPVLLQHLNLSRTLITDSALEFISGLTNLRSLSLDETQVKCLKPLIPLKQLESISLRATPVMPEALLWLGKIQKLNTLNISQLSLVDGDTALELIKDLKLTSLQLPSRLTTSDTGMAFIQGLQLTSLNLTNYIHVTDAGIRCLGKMLSLKVLLLSNTKLTDAGLLALENLHNLEVLYLDRTSITDNGTVVFQSMPKLKELSLSSTSTGKIYLKNGILNGCNLITKLNLSYTQVTDKGLSKLCLPNLSLISLDGTRLRSDPHMLLKNCPQIRHISAKNIEPRGFYDSDND